MAKHGSKVVGSRYIGIYTLPKGQRLVGELKIKGRDTLLRVHAEEPLQRIEDGCTVSGNAYSGECLTLIDCQTSGIERSFFNDTSTQYHADIFPHYVAIGRRHLDPSTACIKSISFTTTDLPTLFYDFDAFGHVIDARPIIDTVLNECRSVRPVETGSRPQVFYFTGKDCIVAVKTAFGEVTAHHRPRFNMGGPTGAYIKNRIVITVEPDLPIGFKEAIERMYDIWSFLSLAAGRQQDLKHVTLTTTDVVDGMPQMLDVMLSFRPRLGGGEQLKPHPRDVPLDPVRRPAEFSRVLSDWIRRHPEWRIARGRYLGCLAKTNKYGAERLVAAANMFDILPTSATPPAATLEADLATTKDECIRALRQLPGGVDRDGAISALGRMGKPSLPKKVLHRTAIVENQMGARFADLKLVVSTAVKCRNFYVHGSAGDLDFRKVEPLVPFLTNALEFVFAASDLIEAGWDGAEWMSEPMGWGHSFARFKADYSAYVKELRNVLAS